MINTNKKENDPNKIYAEAAKSLSAVHRKKLTAAEVRAALLDKMDGRPDKFYFVYDDMADYYRPRFGDGGYWETFDEAVAAFGADCVHDELVNWEFENSRENL